MEILEQGVELARLFLAILCSHPPQGTGAEKPGECPQLPENLGCVKDCAWDKDCADNLKCCQAGCSFVCSTPDGNPAATWRGQGGAAEGCARLERPG